MLLLPIYVLIFYLTYKVQITGFVPDAPEVVLFQYTLQLAGIVQQEHSSSRDRLVWFSGCSGLHNRYQLERSWYRGSKVLFGA